MKQVSKNGGHGQKAAGCVLTAAKVHDHGAVPEPAQLNRITCRGKHGTNIGFV